jgi:aspartate/methionine/tyrosine aminotransferase
MSLPTFSARLPRSLEANRITQVIEDARRAGAPLVDLTESNPTAVGLEYPEPEILAALADPRALRYAPSPRGLAEAREAVAAYYARHGRRVDPERLFFTASTSEAYAFLFKLLCNPTERVLVPQPSYPLFELLSSLEGVAAVGYPLAYHAGWYLELEALAAVADAQTRAVLVVNPNNPTGSFLKRDERERLVAFCRSRNLALISDEVFADYGLSPDPARVTTLVDTDEVLTFSLSGLSKVAGLPQLKLGWIHVAGPSPHVAEAEARLEMIADTFLSVSTPVQLALPRLLELAPSIAVRIAERVRRNRAHLAAAVRDSPCQLLPAEGGWYAVLRVPAWRSEEDWVVDLVTHARVIVHPGFFFDFAEPAYLILSLLPRPEVFDPAVGDTLSRLTT